MSTLILKAWQDGHMAASTLKVGDLFEGAMPAADEWGYGLPSKWAVENDAKATELAILARVAFTSSYLASLPREIRTLDDNIITSIRY